MEELALRGGWKGVGLIPFLKTQLLNHEGKA